ncbi:hypothetical protein [Roseobacter sinensis]|uniref:TIGR03016 family PEP-CTERM system-associated outer membrane protein n=1 Tax=Roseobacter sinensis TaxID=2931391 RepID=A0ABT3BJS2_9RHOB|nr:hypothetical protein [Roseobacter sp. WL0113]MCV3273811.1 hypothetical protein [Roseobacter sp. WL0113]
MRYPLISSKHRRLGLAGVAVVAVGAPLFGPVIVLADPGLLMRFDLSQRLEHTSDDSNSADDGLESITRLGVTLQSLTSAQQLTFSTSAGLSYNFDNSGDTEIDTPSLNLGYVRTSKNAEFTFNGSFREIDLEDSAFVVDPTTNEVVIDTGGTRTTTALSSGLTLGRSGPASLELGVSHREVDFSDTNDTSLNDSTTDAFNATARFRFSPQLTGRLFATSSETDEDGPGQEDTERQTIGVGADYQIDRLTNLSLGVSYEDNETIEDSGITRNSGLGLDLSATRAVTNGTYTLGVSQSQTDNGVRRQVRLGRTLEWRQTDISWSLGATKTEGFSTQPLLGLNIDQTIDKLSTISVSLSQSATTSSSDAESVATRLSINYFRELSKLSSLSSGIQLVDENVLNGTSSDESTVRFNVTYNHTLAQGWSLSSGYVFTTTRQDNTPDEDTSELFVSIQKSFSLRP